MIQQRLSLASIIAAATAVVALGLPGMASAAYEHPANNEKGIIVHQEHWKSEKTREQVIAETKAAMQQGRLSYGQSNYPFRTSEAGPGKTREQVINEMLNESSAERDTRERLYYPG
ncbi:DUF4148 domain-containing protein [Comamonas endophytica]|uniref:DUF4148 domain-containing protein n=1 Tax=Comamonas endophytica TaxID=2949090 RepID=A0ABY6GHV2_9BURK|nr:MULTISPECIES: DUF4148 domain-containing protein [unclassified Acidovorax]MCD2514633.1 DUF4148 domain-containing protein [Acidovorax sp. D4N7]UYG53947.1 DUF4148 domain-containing protein [Acidovorax sp. 5MLIR]